MSPEAMPPEATSREFDPESSLEIFVLVVLGLFMVLFGALLFRINNGSLNYNPDSTYGLFLVIVAFQVATLGKTPLGDFRRSWLLLIIGFGAAAIGLFGCFIPGVSSYLLRTLVGLILLGGGLVLFAQLWISKEKARSWLQVGGVLRHLTVACGLVYVLMIVLGIRTLIPGTRNIQTAVILLVAGASIFYLAGSLWETARLYPTEWQTHRTRDAGSRANIWILQEASLSLSQSTIILFGLMLLLLGGLLLPVGAGTLPFSPDGQFGVLLTIMAIQTACLGQTPVGQFGRSWPVFAVGVALAGLGIVSAIAPGALTNLDRILVGILNIAGGVVSLIRMQSQARAAHAAEAKTPVELKRLAVNQTAQSLAAIAFGITALIPGLIPLLFVAGILVIYGLLLFDTVFLLSKVAKLSPA